MTDRLQRNKTHGDSPWQSVTVCDTKNDSLYDSLMDSFSLCLSTALLPHWTAATTKEKFLQNRGWSELRIWIEWPQMKSQNDTEAPWQCPNCLLTTSLVSAGWWEDQPFYVSTLYYSLGNCNSLPSLVSPPSSQAFQWLDSKPLETFCFTVFSVLGVLLWPALWTVWWWWWCPQSGLDDLFVSPIFMAGAGWRYHYYLLTAAKCPASPMIKQHSRVFVPFWCQESGNWELLWCAATCWGARSHKIPTSS